MPEAAFREVMFQIQNGWIIYVLATLSILLLAYSFYRRVRLWTLGQKDDARGPGAAASIMSTPPRFS